MKIRISWPVGIVIAMISFMAFILSFVYKSMALDEYHHELVSEDYYKDELYYQEEIDKLNNAKTLSQNIVLSNSKEGIQIQFPKDLDQKEISGIVFFQRLSNKKLDFTLDLNLTDHRQLVPSKNLISGKWIVKIDWKFKDEEYLFKDSWFY